jgi:quercetin 2,3-dioxygenase
MTAGRGIIHSEMPEQQDGLMWGFQLWVNLPAAHKMDPPRYQDIPPGRIPQLAHPGGARVRVVAGRSRDAEGPVRGIVTDPLYLDVALPGDAVHTEPVPAGHTALVYAFEGAGRIGDAGEARSLRAGQLALLGEGDAARAAASPAGLRFLLLAARPLGEPIARYGPFVMNTREEIQKAVEDFRNGTFLG